jgi:hypothetical protein
MQVISGSIKIYRALGKRWGNENNPVGCGSAAARVEAGKTAECRHTAFASVETRLREFSNTRYRTIDD